MQGGNGQQGGTSMQGGNPYMQGGYSGSPYPKGGDSYGYDASGGFNQYGKGGYGKGTSKGKGKGGKGKDGKSFGKDGFGKGFGGSSYGFGKGYYGENPADLPAISQAQLAAKNRFMQEGAKADPRRQIEMAQRRAKNRDQSGIALAQQAAHQRFEKDLIDRITGKWVDLSDPKITYTVEGTMCSVSGGGEGRVFRNRISAFGGDLCLDAKRWWHKLNMSSLPPLGEQVERVEWLPGKDSPPTNPITWIRASADGEEAAEQESAPVSVPTPPAPPRHEEEESADAAEAAADEPDA